MPVDCFKACADLPKQWPRQKQMFGCLGLATNKALLTLRNGGRFRSRRFARNCARGDTPISLCLPCLGPIWTFYPSMVYGNIVPSLRGAGIEARTGHTSFIQRVCWNHGRCETRGGKKE